MFMFICTFTNTSGSSSNTSEGAEDQDATTATTGPVIGTLQLPSGEEFSFGHHNGQERTSCPGNIEGLVRVQFYTDAPPSCVAGIRGMGLGPLLSVVATSEDEQCGGGRPIQTLGEATTAVSNVVEGGAYVEKFRRALSVWYAHSQEVWFDGLENGGDGKCKALQTKFEGAGLLPLSYRVSCLRSHPKKQCWKTDDIVSTLADKFVPVGELSGTNLNCRRGGVGKGNGTLDNGKRWKVDLKHYDFEVVVLFHHNTISVAVSLRPYQHLSTKNYSTGRLPPDVTPPYITAANSESIVRLRPSTAAHLLALACLKPGDVVLDPCGGINSIPVEASLCERGCVGIGGDIVVLQTTFREIASRYSAAAKSYNRNTSCGCRASRSGVSEILAWDAAFLPLRDGCVDCIISDLPFGQKCLSSKKLSEFLPLIVAECARVLRPGVGRIVFLCGAWQNLKDAVDLQNRLANALVLRTSSIFPLTLAVKQHGSSLLREKQKGQLKLTTNVTEFAKLHWSVDKRPVY
jgi:tRNA G10  N-methylase Trm11